MGAEIRQLIESIRRECLDHTIVLDVVLGRDRHHHAKPDSNRPASPEFAILADDVDELNHPPPLMKIYHCVTERIHIQKVE